MINWQWLILAYFSGAGSLAIILFLAAVSEMDK
jgi:hypothetical protein